MPGKSGQISANDIRMAWNAGAILLHPGSQPVQKLATFFPNSGNIWGIPVIDGIGAVAAAKPKTLRR